MKCLTKTFLLEAYLESVNLHHMQKKIVFIIDFFILIKKHPFVQR